MATKQLLAFVCTLLATMLLVAEPTPAATGSGTLSKVKMKSLTDQISNGTENWQNAITKKVTLNSSTSGCIVVRFNTVVVLDDADPEDDHNQVQFRAKIDSIAMQPESWVTYTANEETLISWFDHFAGEWWRCGLAGNGTQYNVKVQYRHAPGGGAEDTAYLDRRSLIIQYDE